MNALWAEVQTASGARVGDGPILIKSASISRTMDGPGSFSMEALYTPANEQTLLVERRVFVYLIDNDVKRLVAQGIIHKARRKYASSTTLSVSGPELMEELKYTNTLLNRQYDQQALKTVVTTLAGLAGWTVTYDTTFVNLITARFDGVSVLKAVQEIIKDTGYHMRQGTSERVLEFGTFGASSGLTLVNVDSPMAGNSDIAIISDFGMEDDGEQIINWLLPIGAGEGEAALTLKNSTRSGIGSMSGADGKTIYYLSDPSSIALYGIKQKTGVFKNIAPLNNSVVSKQVAANALADAGRAFLQRSANPIRRYTASLKQCFTTLKAGDKVRVKYTGVMRQADGEDAYARIDEDLWILKVSENHGEGGSSVSLELANIDKVKMDSAKVIVGALENMEVRNLKPQAYPYWSENTYTDIVSNNTNPSYSRWADFKLEIDNSVLEISRVRLRIKTLRLYTYSAVRLEPSAINVPSVPYLSPGIFPTQFYSVVESDDWPSGITFYFAGVDVSAQFGGPWNVGANVQTDITLDITDLVVNAAGGIYQSHSIQFRCENRLGNCTVPGMPVSITGDVSNGVVECNIRVQGTCQAIISA